MARPKKNSNSPFATQKIEQAFWRLLETEGYSSITILRLSQETGLNRNTFYYHYRNVDDIVRQAFTNSVDKQSIMSFIDLLLSTPEVIDLNAPEFLNTKRLHLIAKSKSTFLHKLIKRAMLETWCNALEIRQAELCELDRAQLEFIAAGILTLLGNEQLLRSNTELYLFPKSPLGQAIIQTLNSLSKNIQTSETPFS